jgi:phosphoribosylformylglycinamidine synthase subunit PurS
MYKIGVRIMPRTEVLDTQGRAVGMTLKSKGFQLLDCKVGKYVILQIEGESREQARAQATKISEDLLCNTLIETFQIEELP